MNTSMSHLVQRLLACLCLLLAAPFAHALSMSITVNPDRVRPNEGVIASITVTNETASAVNFVTLRMQMPTSGVNTIDPYYASGSGSCPGDCDPGEFVTWNIGTLGAGRGVTVTLPVVVANGTASGTVINFPASALVAGVQQLTVSQSVTVDANNALSLSVFGDKDGVVPGGTLTYTVHYGNRSGVSTTGTALALPLPAGTTFVSATGNGALSGNTVLWDLNTLQGGQSGRQQVVVSVGAGVASGTLLTINAAQLSGTSSSTGPEIARTTFSSRVQGSPALQLTIASNADPARPNQGVRTAFTVSNPTSATVFGAVLTARMPAAGFNTIDPYYHSGSAACRGDCDPYEFVNWSIGTLPPGRAVTVVMAGSVVNGYSSGRLINIDAQLTADGAPMVIGHRTIAVDDDNALSLNLEVDKDGVAPGDNLTYAVTYGNRQAYSVTGTTLRLPLPAGTTFVSATGGGTASAGAVQWNLNTIQAGQSSRQQVVVRVDPVLGSGALLTVDAAVISGNSVTTITESARATLTSRVLTDTGLGLSIASNADPARPNGNVRTAFTVSNRSADTPAFGVVLKARMPMEGFNTIDPYYHTGGVTCRGDCDPYEFVTWNIGTLAPGASTTVWMQNSVVNGFGAGRLITIESELTGDGLPLTVARKSLAVDGDNALSLALHADKDSASPGERVTYTLDYGNRSTGTVNGTVLSFPVPAGASLVSASGGTLTSSRVNWNLAGLLAGNGGRRTVTVIVPLSAPAGQALRIDGASITGNSAVTGAEQARSTLTTRVVAGNPLRLSLIGLAANPVLPNQALTATLRISNIGSEPLNTINLKVRVPAEGVNTFAPSALSVGGQCRGDCDPSEFAVWNFATLGPGASTTVTMPMTVVNGFTSGRHILLQAVVVDDNGNQSMASGTALAGTVFSDTPAITVFGDFDGNSVVGFSDLAAFKANFGTANAAYDLDGNGVVNFADLAILKTLFGNASSAAAGPALPPAADTIRRER